MTPPREGKLEQRENRICPAFCDDCHTIERVSKVQSL